jgi:hypothetical protein
MQHDACDPMGHPACEICSQLKDVETSFYKWGWDEMDRPLPIAAARLVQVMTLDAYEPALRSLRQCPLCGTGYLYESSYEYLVNGSEDEEVLTRLTAEQTQTYLAAMAGPNPGQPPAKHSPGAMSP